MMRASSDPKNAANLILIAACVLLAGSVAGILWTKFDRKLDVATIKRQGTDDVRKEQQKIRKAHNAAVTDQAEVSTRTWAGADSAITGGILNLVTTLSKKRGTSFVRLQPQRISTGGALEQLPYLLVVEGPFPAIVALEKDLEIPANRLAINGFQITSTDSESNKVSATISVVAMRVPVVVETKETTKRASTR